MDNLKITKKEIEQAVIKKVAKSFKDIDSKVDKMVELSICSVLGLNIHGYNGYEIDHCNGRSSILTRVLEDRARKQVEKIVNNFKSKEEEIPLVKKAFEEEFSKELLRTIKYRAQELAEKISRDIIEEYTLKSLKKLGFGKEEDKGGN